MTNFSTLTKQIAIELTILGTAEDSPIWSVGDTDNDSYHPHAYLTADDGRKISLWADSKNILPNSRIEITGAWPSSNKDNYHCVSHYDNPPKITAAMSRGGQAIAKDIFSRFLPGFNVLWANSTKRIKEHDEMLAKNEDKMQAILQMWPTARKSGHETYKIYLGNEFSKHHGHTELSYGDGVTLQLSGLSLAQVRQIAAIVEPKEFEDSAYTDMIIGWVEKYGLTVHQVTLIHNAFCGSGDRNFLEFMESKTRNGGSLGNWLNCGKDFTKEDRVKLTQLGISW